jgi:transposase
VSVPEGVSLERLVARLEELEARVAELEAENTALRAENTELKRRLGQNSRNSSKPPSADGLEQAPPPRSLRRATGRKPGKQPGTQGFSLGLTDDPDVVIEHIPAACRRCGSGLDTAMVVAMARHQVTDVPAVSVTVTEHRIQSRRCGCGCVTSADRPAGVSAAPGCYGPNLRAWVVYLLVFQHVPVARVAELVADLCGARPSTGWICGVLRAVSAALADVEALIRTLLTAAHILHVDETGIKVTGARWWLHVAATDTLTAYHLDTSRGRAAINTLDILPGFTGVAVHDCWSAYDGYPDCQHALCGAHIARELVAAAETHPDQHWPTQAIEALFALNTAAHQARDQRQLHIPPEIADPVLHRWRHAVLVGLSSHPRRPGRKQSKTRNLLERLRDREADVLRFAGDLTVPFTNNQAERDLRPAKTQMKISGTHRSETSAKAWARVRGYISTARKHGITAYDAILTAVTGNPWTPLPTT